MLRKYMNDPYYMLRYCLLSAAVFGLIDALLVFAWRAGVYSISFDLWHISLIPLGAYLGCQSAVFIHNATHNNIKPLWLNSIIGEICGTQQVWGYLGWRLTHLLHHKYPDNPDLDPHPPGNLGFWSFAFKMKTTSVKSLRAVYKKKFGNTPRIARIEKLKNVAGLLAFISRGMFWVLLLGPSLFVLFYLPSYIANFLFFAHINYAAHQHDNQGQPKIHNLNHNHYYKIMNYLFAGIYFHQNHHSRPSYFNPMYATLSKSGSETDADDFHQQAA